MVSRSDGNALILALQARRHAGQIFDVRMPLDSPAVLHLKAQPPVILYGVLRYIPILLLGLAGCATVEPPPTVDRVDLPRFMGDWYVIAGQFTPFEKGAHNTVESYRLDEKGRIPTTFTFNKGAPDGPRKTIRSIAFVHNPETQAEWRVQFFWPLRFPYFIVFLDEEYQATAVTTRNRKYVWVMARSPELDPALEDRLMRRLAELGFDTNRFVRVPHAREAIIQPPESW